VKCGDVAAFLHTSTLFPIFDDKQSAGENTGLSDLSFQMSVDSAEQVRRRLSLCIRHKSVISTEGEAEVEKTAVELVRKSCPEPNDIAP